MPAASVTLALLAAAESAALTAASAEFIRVAVARTAPIPDDDEDVPGIFCILGIRGIMALPLREKRFP
jgi:hypothetical protein